MGADGWDELVRGAASLRDDTVTASLLVGRLRRGGEHGQHGQEL
jgi:hypothetical protein